MKRSILRRLPACIGLVGAAFLIWLAVPRTFASIMLAVSKPAYEQINNPALPLADIAQLKDRLLRVIDWVDEREVQTRLGYVELALASRAENEAERQNHLALAETAFENAIAHSPMDPFSWARLCYIRLQTGGAEDGTAMEALSTSLVTGPYERSLAISQIEYAAILWDQLSEDDQKTIEEKVRWIETLERRDLIALAKQNPKTMTLVIRAMADGDIDRFTRFIVQLNK
ncbi:MAG: hypothetical protein CMO06_12900 [Thalassospira sp.]|uniref:hypothetical protein n=1 Tax=Thalassospira sp. TaxID=1912094 RepID=UPI000C4CEC8A|nr:hypothetical protein [Thalassospira sp.]MAZ34035.1 hypothetical protein [Thalassospira sp.]